MSKIIFTVISQIILLGALSLGVMFLWNKLIAPGGFPEVSYLVAVLLTLIITILTGATKINLTLRD